MGPIHRNGIISHKITVLRVICVHMEILDFFLHVLYILYEVADI